MYKYENLVTILTSSVPQHKSWFLNENSKYELVEKKFAKYYSFSEVAISDIYDLHALIEQYTTKKNAAFIRGKITESAYKTQLKGYRVRRVANEKYEKNVLLERTIKDYPKKWIMLDIDNFPKPNNTILNVKKHREKAVEQFISTLHESFHKASYICQFSNGMFLNSDKIKAHLWFMLSESYNCEVLEPWFEKNCKGVDPCVFRPAQLIYTADPVFENTSDPLKNNRLYIKEKDFDVVCLPKKSIVKEYLNL